MYLTYLYCSLQIVHPWLLALCNSCNTVFDILNLNLFCTADSLTDVLKDDEPCEWTSLFLLFCQDLPSLPSCAQYLKQEMLQNVTNAPKAPHTWKLTTGNDFDTKKAIQVMHSIMSVEVYMH